MKILKSIHNIAWKQFFFSKNDMIFESNYQKKKTLEILCINKFWKDNNTNEKYLRKAWCSMANFHSLFAKRLDGSLNAIQLSKFSYCKEKGKVSNYLAYSQIKQFRIMQVSWYPCRHKLSKVNQFLKAGMQQHSKILVTTKFHNL